MRISSELKERLNSIRYTGGYYYQQYDPKSDQPVNFNQDGIEMLGFNRNIHYLARYERPAHIGALMSQLAVITNASPKYRKQNGETYALDTALAEASRTVTLRRLKQEQKDYILDWIYSGCKAFGRNDHEAATLVPFILGGYNSLTIHSQNPHEPRLGAMGKTMETLRLAVQTFQVLGAYKGQDRDAMVLQIMLEAGVDKEKIANVTHARILHRQLGLDQLATGIKQWLQDVTEALYAVDHEADNHAWDLEDLSTATRDKSRVWGSSVFGNTYRAASLGVNGLAANWDVISYDPEPLEAMLPTLMKDVANQIKRWNKTHG